MAEEPQAEIVLTPPEPPPVVEDEQAGEMVKLDDETIQKLDDQVLAFVDTIVNADVHSEPFEERLAAIHGMGTREIREAANVSNRILERPVRSMDEDAPVTKALVKLRRTVEELDPAREEDARRKFLGIIPFGDKVNSYFQKYQSAQHHIDAVLNSLQSGQDTLRKDNATIEQEKANLWDIMHKLRQYIYVGKQLDAAIEQRLVEMEERDPEKARVVREELQFYVRQKVQDLLTQLAVSVQGYLALDMVRKNNMELIKGVERASTTTVSALRTAIIVAQALSNQKLVLDQVNSLNTTTSDLIASTSTMLKDQTGQIHEQAASATVGMEQLQAAFNNVFATIDMISDFKLQALDNMQQSVNALSTQVERANTYLDRTRQEAIADATKGLALPAEDDGIVKL
jgi:uncharacterized protein YaaN involved in tellurite resistance